MSCILQKHHNLTFNKITFFFFEAFTKSACSLTHFSDLSLILMYLYFCLTLLLLCCCLLFFFYAAAHSSSFTLLLALRSSQARHYRSHRLYIRKSFSDLL